LNGHIVEGSLIGFGLGQLGELSRFSEFSFETAHGVYLVGQLRSLAHQRLGRR
jgi:hypothetical protein